MQDGAVGVSTSLQYAPAPYASTEELIALAREASKYGGIYATHMRSEGDAIFEAIDEAVRIGREAQIPVEIWHLKAAGKRNWGPMPKIVAKIDAARPRGVDVAPTRTRIPPGSTLFRLHSAVGARRRRQETDRAAEGPGDARAHPQRHARHRMQPVGKRMAGDSRVRKPSSSRVVQNPQLLPLQGKTLAQIAKHRRQGSHRHALRSARRGRCVHRQSPCSGCRSRMSRWRCSSRGSSVDNDSQGTAPDGLLGKEHPHPRAYGTFPRILRKYVREEHKLTLEDAIRKFTRCRRSACA